MTHDRSGNKLRKERHEQTVVQEVPLRCGAAVVVHEVGYLLEREETHAKGQRHAQQWRTCDVQRQRDVLHDEIGVLVVPEKRDVEHDAQRKPRPPFHGASAWPGQESADGVVHANGGEDDAQIPGLPVCVIEQGRRHEPSLADPCPSGPAQQEKPKRRDREEQKQIDQ